MNAKAKPDSSASSPKPTAPPGLTIADIIPEDLPSASALLARSYRDNPLTIAMVGADPDLRLRLNELIFGTRIAAQDPPALVARIDGSIVGVCGLDPPGGSQMSADDQRALAAELSSAGGGIAGRTAEMLAEWKRHEPKEPHWHIGPIGVEPELQGGGVGSAMVARLCAMMDKLGAIAYLETDLEANAQLYERFSFTTVDVAPVIGVQMWFMIRYPAA
jgi:GNAT superfamily N-acetyltransferase